MIFLFQAFTHNYHLPLPLYLPLPARPHPDQTQTLNAFSLSSIKAFLGTAAPQLMAIPTPGVSHKQIQMAFRYRIKMALFRGDIAVRTAQLKKV